MTKICSDLFTQKISFSEYQEQFKTLFYKCLEGDYAVCFYDNMNQILILTRDMFGKRSLMVAFSEEGPLTIMSTSVFPIGAKVYEVPANSILFIATSEMTGMPENIEEMTGSFELTVIHSRNYDSSPSQIRWKRGIFTSDNPQNGKEMELIRL